MRSEVDHGPVRPESSGSEGGRMFVGGSSGIARCYQEFARVSSLLSSRIESIRICWRGYGDGCNMLPHLARPSMYRSISCFMVLMCAAIGSSAPVPKETQPSVPYVKWTVKPENERKAMN